MPTPLFSRGKPLSVRRPPRWLTVLVLGAWPLLAAPVFHVSPMGDDGWSGRLSTPSRLGRDGPFRTLERARQAVRAERDADGARVVLAAGEYVLPEGFALEAGDLGSQAAPIVYEAAPEALVVLRGDRPLADWRLGPGGSRFATLPAGGNPALFAEDQPLPLARFPNRSPSHPSSGGFCYVLGAESAGGTLFLRVAGLADLAPGSWADLAGSRVWIWPEDGSRRETVITAANRERGTLCLPDQPGIRPGTRLVLVGLPGELDAPGEWYPEPELGRMRLVPPEELVPEREVTVATAPALISIRGRAEDPLPGVQFVGLEFRGSAGDVVRIADAAGVFVRCAFRAGVGDGIRAERAGGLQVEGGDFRRLGGAAIHLTATRGAVIRNCWIAETGFLQDVPAAIVAADETCENIQVVRNLLHDLPASGIFLQGGGHRCEGNWLHHLGQERAGGGGILLPGGTANTVRGNLVADPGGYRRLDGFRYAFPAGSAGVAVQGDDGSVAENLLLRCPVGVRVAGRNLRVENNLFAGAGEAHIQLGAATALAVRRNVAFSHLGETAWLAGDRLPERLTEADWNLLWHESRDPFVRSGGAEISWPDWQALGFDR
ncbi:MAG: right-handed parallel beta-helix repeat-containing protein, partial [Lentisphaeria bacterium]|nr:right-handed parallel beta-helix repeat-containing protein [Lentisphaeria bacterium]